VLLYTVEDAWHIVRQRLERITCAAGVNFASLNVRVTVPTLRLDRSEHQQALQATVAHLEPKLLVLDPFVRLHAIDENVAGEDAPLLICARCSATTAPPSPSSTLPARALRMSAVVRRLEDRQSCTPGATRTSICGVTARTSTSISSIAPRPASTGCSSPSKPIRRRSRSRWSSHRPPTHVLRRNHRRNNASNRSWLQLRRPSRNGNCVRRRSTPAT
jgi:hypothetical protein